MSTLLDQPIAARHEAGCIHIEMSGGESLSFPIKGNPRLERASEADLDQIELSPFGLHWPKLDEDLSIRGIRQGDYGSRN
jgi:hypothetical protein